MKNGIVLLSCITEPTVSSCVITNFVKTTLKTPAKTPTENVVCLSRPLANVSIEANSDDDLDLHCSSLRLQNISADDKNRRLLVIRAHMVNKCVFQFIYSHGFQEMHARLRGSNNRLTMSILTQIINIT